VLYETEIVGVKSQKKISLGANWMTAREARTKVREYSCTVLCLKTLVENSSIINAARGKL